VTFTHPASVTCLPISLLRSELQSCMRNMRCAQKYRVILSEANNLASD
jgi:hypothetical protein